MNLDKKARCSHTLSTNHINKQNTGHGSWQYPVALATNRPFQKVARAPERRSQSILGTMSAAADGPWRSALLRPPASVACDRTCECRICEMCSFALYDDSHDPLKLPRRHNKSADLDWSRAGVALLLSVNRASQSSSLSLSVQTQSELAFSTYRGLFLLLRFISHCVREWCESKAIHDNRYSGVGSTLACESPPRTFKKGK